MFGVQNLMFLPRLYMFILYIFFTRCGVQFQIYFISPGYIFEIQNLTIKLKSAFASEECKCFG